MDISCVMDDDDDVSIDVSCVINRKQLGETEKMANSKGNTL